VPGYGGQAPRIRRGADRADLLIRHRQPGPIAERGDALADGLVIGHEFGVVVGRQVDLALLARARAHQGHHLLAHATAAAFCLDVVAIDRPPAEGALRVAALGAERGVEAKARLGGRLHDLEAHARPSRGGDHAHRDVAAVLAALPAEPGLLHQGHRGAAGGVLARHRTRPEVGYGRQRRPAC